MSACPHPEKRRYRTKAEARTVIAAMYATGNGNPDLRPYGCTCGAIHIGHSAKHFNQRIKRSLRRNRKASR